MTGYSRGGFTIIETMLFLAISGLLVVGILGGTGYAINIQRYGDAVNSLQNYFQGEFGIVANAQNDRDNFLTCSSGALSSDGGGLPRGTTDCLIIGQLVTVAGDGKSLQSQTVYAGADGSDQTNDIDALQHSSLFVSDVVQPPSDYALEWGTALALPGGTIPSGYQLLIVRSPSSGTIRTFTAEKDVSLQGMVADSARLDRIFCVDSQGLIAFGNRGVKILKDAANASAVKVAEGGC